MTVELGEGWARLDHAERRRVATWLQARFALGARLPAAGARGPTAWALACVAALSPAERADLREEYRRIRRERYAPGGVTGRRALAFGEGVAALWYATRERE